MIINSLEVVKRPIPKAELFEILIKRGIQWWIIVAHFFLNDIDRSFEVFTCLRIFFITEIKDCLVELIIKLPYDIPEASSCSLLGLFHLTQYQFIITVLFITLT